MSATPRQVSNAVGLIIAGAMRDVDSQQDISETDIYFAVLRELKDWVDGEPELAKLLAEDLAKLNGGKISWPD